MIVILAGHGKIGTAMLESTQMVSRGMQLTFFCRIS